MSIVYTVGHSNRSYEEFVDILKAYNIKLVVDVRRFPGSRKVPWTEKGRLEESLRGEGIRYVWLGELLGGFRSGGYKAYVDTGDYKRGLEKLVSIINENEDLITIMCKERLWLQCHRRFISDSLKERGYKVIHIIEKDRVYEHKGGGAAGI